MHFSEQVAQLQPHGLNSQRAPSGPWSLSLAGNVLELQRHRTGRSCPAARLRLDGVLAETDVGARAVPSTAGGVRAVIPEIEWRRRERENVRMAVQLAKGRIYGPDGAADMLGVKPTTLISRLRALGVREPPRRPRRRKNRS